jgi:hypothetical protein
LGRDCCVTPLLFSSRPPGASSFQSDTRPLDGAEAVGRTTFVRVRIHSVTSDASHATRHPATKRRAGKSPAISRRLRVASLNAVISRTAPLDRNCSVLFSIRPLQNGYIQFESGKNFHLATRRALTYASYAISETFRVTVTMGLRSVVRPDWLNSKGLSTTGSETSRSR